MSFQPIANSTKCFLASYEALADDPLAPSALPLPPAEWHASTTKVYPKDEFTERLMRRVGSVIAFDDFSAMVRLSVGSLMGHFYKTLQTQYEWLVWVYECECV